MGNISGEAEILDSHGSTLTAESSTLDCDAASARQNNSNDNLPCKIIPRKRFGMKEQNQCVATSTK